MPSPERLPEYSHRPAVSDTARTNTPAGERSPRGRRFVVETVYVAGSVPVFRSMTNPFAGLIPGAASVTVMTGLLLDRPKGSVNSTPTLPDWKWLPTAAARPASKRPTPTTNAMAAMTSLPRPAGANRPLRIIRLWRVSARSQDQRWDSL